MNNRSSIGIYGMVPIALLQDETITSAELRVYTAISSFQGGNDKAWPGIDDIALRVKMHPTTCSKAIKKLKLKNWISVKRRFGQNNIYSVFFEINPPDVAEKPSTESGLQASTNLVTEASTNLVTEAISLQDQDKITKENINTAKLGLQPESLTEKKKTKKEQEKELHLKIKKYLEIIQEIRGSKMMVDPKEYGCVKKLAKHFETEEELRRFIVAFKQDSFWGKNEICPSALSPAINRLKIRPSEGSFDISEIQKRYQGK